MCTILGLPVDKLRYFHDKCLTLRSKTKMTQKYFKTKTLFKEVTNLPLEVVHHPTPIILNNYYLYPR